MISTCPDCGTDTGVTHGDQLSEKRRCPECAGPQQCPVCGHPDDLVAVGVHLSDRHQWDYQKVLDWIRSKENA